MRILACALLLASLGTCGGKVDQGQKYTSSPVIGRPAPALENARGIIGGPRDETAFEFEAVPVSESDTEPELDGIPNIPDAILTGLTPYLEARQTRIAAVDGATSSLIVLSRTGEVRQAHRVKKPLGDLVPLTFGTDPVSQAALIPGNGKHMLFRRDLDGNEQHQIFRLTLATGKEERLTDGRSRYGSFTLARDNRLAFTSNQRNVADMDVYVAPSTVPLKPRRLLERGGQWTVGPWSRTGERILVRHYRSADSSSVYIAHTATGQLEPLTLEKNESLVRDARFGDKGDTILLVSDAGGDSAGLYERNLETGDVRPLSDDLPWDVELVTVSQDRQQVAFVSNEDGLSVLYLLDVTSGERRIATGIPPGVISTVQFVGQTDVVALTFGTAQEPADAYTYDPNSEEMRRWTDSSTPGLKGKPFVQPDLVRIESFDKIEVPAFLYQPPGEGPFPVLLWIHGGPEAQHRPSFDPLLQYFVAELGVAVVAPNIRGSSGYGRRYLSLDDGLRRSDAVRDIGAILDWVELQPKLDAARTGIYGASYGGFIVLASLVEYGERIAAGCDLVGISHLVSFLERTSEYRRDLRRPEYGDERDPEIRNFLDRISPLSNADKIRSPLLVGHGANDPRVPLNEAEQIVHIGRDAGAEVWYFLARDEGHGFRKRRTRDLFYAVMATFFEKHLVSREAQDDGTDSRIDVQSL